MTSQALPPLPHLTARHCPRMILHVFDATVKPPYLMSVDTNTQIYSLMNPLLYTKTQTACEHCRCLTCEHHVPVSWASYPSKLVGIVPVSSQGDQIWAEFG